MSDYLDRMDDLFGYSSSSDSYVMTSDELKLYDVYDVDHYYEIRLSNNNIEVTERGRTMVYENKENHNKYKLTWEGLEQFGTFRFNYFMVSLTPDKEHFKKMVLDRLRAEKKAAYNKYRATAAQIDMQIADVEGIEV